MLNWILLGLAALLTLTEGGVNASASERYTFALVPNNTDSPYFDKAFEGCKKAQKETGDGVRCLYIGPGRNGGSDEQALIVHDLVANEVDGIAVAPSDVSAVAAALKAAGVKNIPIVTWNSDLSAKDTSLRAAFVGADDYQIGARIAKIILKKKPNGGVVCILAESVTEATDSKRVQESGTYLPPKGAPTNPSYD